MNILAQPSTVIPQHFNGALVFKITDGKFDEAKVFPNVNIEHVNFIDLHGLAVERGRRGGRPDHPLKKEALDMARELRAISPRITIYRLIVIIAGRLHEKSLYAPSVRSLENWFNKEFKRT